MILLLVNVIQRFDLQERNQLDEAILMNLSAMQSLYQQQ